MFLRKKYKFDPNTLSHVEEKNSLILYIRQFTPHIIVSLGLSLLMTIAFNTIWSSPEETVLKRENEFLKTQYDKLQSDLVTMNTVLNELQDKDDNIYRAIFNTEPLPESKRKAGYGGADLHAKLVGYNHSDLVIETAQKLEQLKKSLVVQSKSYDEIVELASNRESMMRQIPAIQPVSNKHLKQIASGFGWRLHPIYKIKKFHYGIDFTASVGTPIYATGDGQVLKVKKAYFGYGKVIVVDHGFGYKTLYAHLQDFAVQPGQQVKRGQVIGYVGNSGTSTAPHLHYEVLKNDRPVDPKNFFIQDLTPQEYDKMIELTSRGAQSLD
jgi:murein DD-endopeptidase MepM/ murein hydrolase activator NlpD